MKIDKSPVTCPPSAGSSCSFSFSDLSFVPIDFWRRHFLIYDNNFHKVGSCDLWHGVWHFIPANSSESFMGFTRDDAIRSWLSYV